MPKKRKYVVEYSPLTETDVLYRNGNITVEALTWPGVFDEAKRALKGRGVKELESVKITLAK